MTELKEVRNRPFEERAAEVRRWIDYFSAEGSVGILNREIIKVTLADLGANFETLDEAGKRSLAGYSNRAKHLGMEQVWGSRGQEFRTWSERWARQYELEEGVELHKIVFKNKKTGKRRISKTEGMRQFFGEITSYAAGCLSFFDLGKRLRARWQNFGKPEDKREKITVSGYNLSKKSAKEKPFAPASFPPEFPTDAWDEIVSWRR